MDIEKYNEINYTRDDQTRESTISQEEIYLSLEKPCTAEELAQEIQKARVVVASEKGNNPIIDVAPGDHLPKLEWGIFKQIEDAFETIGGGTGEEIKTDGYNEKGFHQLVVVDKNPEAPQQLLAGYRYYPRWKAWDNEDIYIDTPMTHYFDFGTNFLTNTHNRIIELGTARSNVNLPSKEKMFHFAGAWTGLGNLLTTTEATHFIGKMTIPADYPKLATDFALHYLHLFSTTQGGELKDPEVTLEIDDIQPKEEYKYQPEYLGDLVDMSAFTGNYKQDFPLIKATIQELTHGKYSTLPGMFDTYLGRIDKIRVLGSILNGPVIETGILAEVSAVKSTAKEKYLNAVKNWGEAYGDEKNVTVAMYRKVVLALTEWEQTHLGEKINAETYKQIIHKICAKKTTD